MIQPRKPAAAGKQSYVWSQKHQDPSCTATHPHHGSGVAAVVWTADCACIDCASVCVITPWHPYPPGHCLKPQKHSHKHPRQHAACVPNASCARSSTCRHKARTEPQLRAPAAAHVRRNGLLTPRRLQIPLATPLPCAHPAAAAPLRADLCRHRILLQRRRLAPREACKRSDAGAGACAGGRVYGAAEFTKLLLEALEDAAVVEALARLRARAADCTAHRRVVRRAPGC